MKAVALRALADQNFKTQLARNYPNIPPNAVVEVITKDFINFYGVFCQVIWEGNTYYVDESELSFNLSDVAKAELKVDEGVQQYIEVARNKGLI